MFLSQEVIPEKLPVLQEAPYWAILRCGRYLVPRTLDVLT